MKMVDDVTIFSSASAMIRKLASGKYRLYSRKKNPKTGRRRISARFLPGQRRRSTSEPFNSTNGINDEI